MKNELFFFAITALFLAISTWAEPVPVENPVNQEEQRNCECHNVTCGCCQYVDLSSIGISGTVCTNFTYLLDDYGVSITLTWNSYTLFNETISARNPPPICFGIPELEKIHAHICLRLLDLSFTKKKFHGCGRIMISVYHIIHKSIDLGCLDIPMEVEPLFDERCDCMFGIMKKGLHPPKSQTQDLPSVNLI